MANRIVLNETSYHGAGAINEIPGEVTKRGFHKAFIASDPDLVKFGVTAKVTKILEENGMDYEVYSNIKPNPTIERNPEQTTLSLSAAVPLWIPPRP